MQDLWCCVGFLYGDGETMLGQALIVAPTQSRPPALIQASGRKARERIEHFLRAAIDNDNTRRAYGRALGSFFAFLEDGGGSACKTSAPSTCATISKPPSQRPFDRHPRAAHGGRAHAVRPLVTGGVLEHNPALSVKAPRQKLGKGKTPVLTAEEAGELLRSIENDTVIGLRDRALIGVMVFTSARISAACGLNVADIFHQQRRLWVRLHEKGGKVHEMPCHHTLEGYLSEYIERARLAEAGRAPLFQAMRYRAYGRGEAILNGDRLHRANAWAMVRRRAKAAGITTEVCNHTFRGTGITAYLENGGTLEKARQMAAHASTRTTQLYDRREDRVTLDEVVRINIRG